MSANQINARIRKKEEAIFTQRYGMQLSKIKFVNVARLLEESARILELGQVIV